jgi:hypothetical protein
VREREGEGEKGGGRGKMMETWGVRGRGSGWDVQVAGRDLGVVVSEEGEREGEGREGRVNRKMEGF